MKARKEENRLVFASTAVEEHTQKQYGQIEARLSPSIHIGCHEGVPGMSVDEFINKQTLEADDVLVGSPKRQDRDETFGPMNLSPFVVYNRDFPRKSRLLFAIMGFISGIHWNIVRMVV